MRQCHKEFGQHTKGAYKFGYGTIAFPEWIKTSVFNDYIKQKRYVGNRHDINFENAMINYPMVEAYTTFLRTYVMTRDDNKLQHRLLLKLQSDEICGALQARSIFHILLMQPLRVMVESTKRGATYLDMIPVVHLLDRVCSEGLENPGLFLDSNYNPLVITEGEASSSSFSDTALDMGFDPQVLRYREHYSTCVGAAFTFETETRKEMLREYIKAYCRGVLVQLKRNSSELRVGGSLSEAVTDELKEKLKCIPTNNIHCERPFAVYDRKEMVHTNSDIHTLCSLTGATVNQTFKLLHELPKDLQEMILKTAFSCATSDCKNTKEIVKACREKKDALRITRQEKLSKKLRGKAKKFYLTESVELIKTKEAVNKLRKDLSDTQFMKKCKEQLNYLQ